MRMTGCAVVLLVTSSWWAQPPAAAFPFPAATAARPDTDPPADPGGFYAQLRAEPSAARLREYLSYLPPGGRHPLSTRVSFAAHVRQVAVEELARRKDRESFEAVLKMVAADPSIRVRTAAAAALGA